MAPASMVSDWAPMQRQQAMPWLSKTSRAASSAESASKIDMSLVNRIIVPRESVCGQAGSQNPRLRSPTG